ncbi:MAG: RnfABCDGE type electron transport complex subunit G [Chromatiaceae bacterium]|nr:RnfABCDGE type electron transport complex subunit G [Gammaproteobacteria bacterium]MCB1880113.1 RnfABCDGE type electron transport complex subunit G [Gammaproteobacteria bacterium]MCB1904313.1 RnfABCDGE type electron transport complex subunit G [Gammaproteobacteria bacterium]MCP5448336.1 RnfABCDGE type electron transport complex subunit G [Chromatiaceae bacterium]
MNAPSVAFRKRILYQALLLGGFSTLATAMLVAGNIATRGAILERQQEDLLSSLNQVVPAAHYDNNLLDYPLRLPGRSGKMLTVYRGTRGMQISSLAYEIFGQGYGGEIRLILGLDAAGRILGVRVLAHAETPGLGDKIEVEKSSWILQFNGLSLDHPPQREWKVTKDGGRFDAFSGATITPRAVLQAIEVGLLFHREHYTELHNPPAIFNASVASDEAPKHE